MHQPRYENPSLRSRPVAMSRSKLLESLSSVHDQPNKSVMSGEVDPQYYFSTSKSQRRYDRINRWLYNSETREVMGRTCGGWLKLFLFYVIFYTVLCGFFAALLSLVMFKIIMVDYPYLTGHQSALNLSPGLGVVPQPDAWTSLISFRMQADSYSKYVDDIIAFSQWYEDYGQNAISNSELAQANAGGFAKCPRSVEESIKDTRKSCRQSLNFGGRCNMHQTFGFDEGMPCLILKLNRIYGWVPDPLDNQTGPIVKCYGLNDVDKDLLGPVCYHDLDDFEGKDLCNKPHGEFKSYFFPYLRQINYQSPLVIVEFVEPVRNTIIMVECRAYAKNIPYNPVTGEGTVRFELLVD